MMSFEMGRH